MRKVRRKSDFEDTDEESNRKKVLKRNILNHLSVVEKVTLKM